MAFERILVVDDQAQVREAIRAILRKAGFLPVLTEHIDEALKFLSAKPACDLILLDVHLRNANGLSFLDTARKSYPQIPVVVVSAIDDIRTVIAAMQRGAFDYLLKPVGGEVLLATIESALQSREAERQDNLHLQTLERLVEARTEMLSRVIADLERSYDITLEALGNALDLKDAETEGHSKRVTAYSIVLARAMKIEAAEVKVIARGAFLHDIGKMAIPDAILSKPGKLTPEEQAVMREHCTRGYVMLKKIPFLEKAAEIVFSHQEHYDGSGYSRGLAGEAIPLGARIFAVADTLDAITSDRPYRKAQSFADARREIERCSGTQFDPAIVAVYRGLPDRLWEELRLEIDQPSGKISSEISETLRSGV
jgi:putative nucleotidyltransferase with HDIG domain